MFLLQLPDLVEKPGSMDDPEGISNKFKKLLREVNEPIETRAMIEPLNIGIKKLLWELISKNGYPEIDKVTLKALNQSKKSGQICQPIVVKNCRR